MSSALPLPLASTPVPGEPGGRLKANFQDILALLLPFLSTYVTWEYRVVAAQVQGAGVTVDCVPVDVIRCPFPPFVGLAVWKGPAGSPSVPVVGSRVLVGFHDGNPAKPAIVGFDPEVPTTPPPGGVYVPPGPLTLAGAVSALGAQLALLTTGPLAPLGAIGTDLVSNVAPLL